MLQAMRNKMHGWPAIILLGISVFAMSFFGMEGYLTSSSDMSVAKVGKHEISQNDMQDRLNQLRQRANAELGDQFDTSIFEKPEMKLRVLNSMIDQQLLLKANDDLGLRVSNQAVRDYIASIPAFQVDGHFDPTSYSAVLASQRKTPEMFESEVRSDLAVQLLPDAINASRIELGPTSGTTLTPRSCARRTSSAPGSATAGQPASETSPASVPARIGASSFSTSPVGVFTFSSRISIS